MNAFRHFREPMNCAEELERDTLHHHTGVTGNTLGAVSKQYTSSVGITYRPELSSLLSNWASDGRTLHFTFWIDNLYTVSS